MTADTTGRLCFVRHGQTFANINKVWHGQTDTELTEEGHEQARRLGAYFPRYLHADVIYTSPLQRARITAEAIARTFKLEVNFDPRLMEMDLGDWEGKTFAELIEAGNIVQKLIDDPDFATPNGESQNIVKQRIVTAVDEISAKHPNENVIIVAHGVTISIAFAHYIDDDTKLWPKYGKSNTAFSEICLQTKQLLSFNKIDHLKE
ncbi:histidine phosphatase family protein [Zhongshania sp.]|uniref:histidine phosphatase family protein n=1 Tax=Zhongshania sp. TaxID=1971902 RepID=UPI0035632C06